MNGLARKRVTLNLKVNVRRSGISILRILLLWFLVSINNMKKTPARSFISDSSRKLARHLEVGGRDQHQQLRYSCSINSYVMS